MKQVCPGCDTEGVGKQGTVADNRPPGWSCVMTFEGGVVHACGDCAQTAADHARGIMGLLKNKNIYFPSLLKWGVDPIQTP